MATLPINELGFRNAKPIGLRPQLNGNPPKEDCPISNLHRCNIWCIRNQFLITERQYKLGMIPHHSMAVHMSKKLLEKENNISSFVTPLRI
jgi:hypothetical protein